MKENNLIWNIHWTIAECRAVAANWNSSAQERCSCSYKDIHTDRAKLPLEVFAGGVCHGQPTVRLWIPWFGETGFSWALIDWPRLKTASSDFKKIIWFPKSCRGLRWRNQGTLKKADSCTKAKTGWGTGIQPSWMLWPLFTHLATELCTTVKFKSHYLFLGFVTGVTTEQTQCSAGPC